MALVIPAPLHRYLRFGLGVGIVAEDHYLEIMVARARPTGLSIAASLRVAKYLSLIHISSAPHSAAGRSRYLATRKLAAMESPVGRARATMISR